VSLIYLSTFSYLPFLQSKFSCKSLSLHINEFQLNMMRSVYTSRIDIVFIHGLRNLFANLIRLVQSGNKVVDASSSCVPHCVSCCCCCDGKLLRVFFRAILSLSEPSRAQQLGLSLAHTIKTRHDLGVPIRVSRHTRILSYAVMSTPESALSQQGGRHECPTRRNCTPINSDKSQRSIAV